MNIEGYENRFLAFLDILGFKDLIKTIEEEGDAAEQALKRVKSILNYLHEESVESNGQHDLPIYEEKDGVVIERALGDPRISYISDCVIISTEGTFDGFKSLCNKVTKFSTDIACDGIFLRGAITYGKLHHHGPILFGSAYQNAYFLESKKANYPRVIIDDIVFDVLKSRKNEFPLCPPTIVKDQDEIQYLANFPFQYHPQYVFSWLDFLLKVKGHILHHLNYFDKRVSGFGPELKKLDKWYCWKEAYGWNLDFTGGDNDVLKKYIWLSEEFNASLIAYRSFLTAQKADSKLMGPAVEEMRIQPIVWNGVIWAVEKELGRLR